MTDNLAVDGCLVVFVLLLPPLALLLLLLLRLIHLLHPRVFVRVDHALHRSELLGLLYFPATGWGTAEGGWEGGYVRACVCGASEAPEKL